MSYDGTGGDGVGNNSDLRGDGVGNNSDLRRNVQNKGHVQFSIILSTSSNNKKFIISLSNTNGNHKISQKSYDRELRCIKSLKKSSKKNSCMNYKMNHSTIYRTNPKMIYEADRSTYRPTDHPTYRPIYRQSIRLAMKEMTAMTAMTAVTEMIV